VKRMHISDTLALPLDEFLTGTQAILAKKGKGKSYTASVQAEELLEAGQQVVVIDPTGAWHGLRSSATGKSSGYSIAILGGEHADVPLEATAGEVIADAIATEHFSAVIDLTLFRKNEALRFMATFLETLYRKNRDALHLFIDEADVVAPQKTFSPEQSRVLGACEDIVRRGRIRGIGCTLISQRAQVVNKDVLSQVDMLTTLGMNHPKDLGAIDDWVAVHGDPKQARLMIESLPSLPRGDAWMWNPASDLFKRVTIRRRRTFDSGKTPKAGERAVVPKVLAPVDLKRLGTAIAATVERAKADDPKALRAKIAELEKLLDRKLSAKEHARVETKVIERAVVKPAEVKRLDGAIDKLDAFAEKMKALAERIEALGAEIKESLTRASGPRPTNREIAARHFANDGKVSKLVGKHEIRVPAVKPMRPLTSETKLPIGEAATLRALIQYPGGLRREQLTVITGYKRSTRDAYIARLRERGYVESIGDRVTASQAGLLEMPDAEPLPTGQALRDWYEQRLPQGERAIMLELCTAYPRAVKREDLDEPTGFKRSTRDAYLSRLAAKELVTEPQRGYVRASDTLFDGGEVPTASTPRCARLRAAALAAHPSEPTRRRDPR
jgi:hypothetical protein